MTQLHYNIKHSGNMLGNLTTNWESNQSTLLPRRKHSNTRPRSWLICCLLKATKQRYNILSSIYRSNNATNKGEKWNKSCNYGYQYRKNWKGTSTSL